MKFSENELILLTKSDAGGFGVSTYSQALEFCKKVTTSHYENFPVASILIPKSLRNHIYAIYSFARIADDISDELYHLTSSQRIELLEQFINELKAFSDSGQTKGNPIFLALTESIKISNIDFLPFERLIKAFQMDADFKQPENFADLLDYCNYSANPIGELILTLFNENTVINIGLSDKLCTALQLTNFWQDISIDLSRGRLYIPNNLLVDLNINNNDLLNPEKMDKLYICINQLFDFTEKLFIESKALISNIKNNRLKFELLLTWYGGMKILKKSKALKVEIFNKRPKLISTDIIQIFISSVFFR